LKGGSRLIEQQILSCLLQDNSLITDTLLQPKHLHNKIYKTIFIEIKKLANEGKVVDQVTLLERLYDKLPSHNDIEYITNLEVLGNVDNFSSYEKELLDKYTKLKTIEILQTNLAKKDELDIDKLMTELESVQEEVANETGDLYELYLRLAEQPFFENSVDDGIPTGFTTLTAKLGGFRSKEFYIVAARPSMGKTALMLKFMRSAMEKDHVPIVFSLEMGEESLVKRLIAQYTKIDSTKIRNPYMLSEKEKQEWLDTVGYLSQRPHKIFTEIRTIPEMRTAIRRAKREFKNKKVIVFLDYLQLLETSEKFQSENYKVEYYSRSLKHMAKDYDVPVVALSQLSRSVEQRQNKRPMLSDLRDSGSIEQDADVVMLLYRDAYYNGENDDNRNILEINVAKHREGEVGLVPVYYELKNGTMGDLSRDEFRRVIDSIKEGKSN